MAVGRPHLQDTFEKDRRSLEEFTTPEYLDDLLFDFDVEDEEGGEDD